MQQVKQTVAKAAPGLAKDVDVVPQQQLFPEVEAGGQDDEVDGRDVDEKEWLDQEEGAGERESPRRVIGKDHHGRSTARSSRLRFVSEFVPEEGEEQEEEAPYRVGFITPVSLSRISMLYGSKTP